MCHLQSWKHQKGHFCQVGVLGAEFSSPKQMHPSTSPSTQKAQGVPEPETGGVASAVGSSSPWQVGRMCGTSEFAPEIDRFYRNQCPTIHRKRYGQRPTMGSSSTTGDKNL